MFDIELHHNEPSNNGPKNNSDSDDELLEIEEVNYTSEGLYLSTYPFSSPWGVFKNIRRLPATCLSCVSLNHGVYALKFLSIRRYYSIHHRPFMSYSRIPCSHHLWIDRKIIDHLNTYFVRSNPTISFILCTQLVITPTIYMHFTCEM